jgi:hypothetical protein
MKTSRVFCLISCLIILLSVSAVADDINYVGSTLWNDIRDVEISGQYAYCVMANGLAVFNISNPQNPYIIFKEYFGAGGSCLFLSELYLYVARHLEGIRIYDQAIPQLQYYWRFRAHWEIHMESTSTEITYTLRISITCS